MFNVIGNKNRKMKLDSRMKSSRKLDLLIYQNEINDEIFDEMKNMDLFF